MKNLLIIISTVSVILLGLQSTAQFSDTLTFNLNDLKFDTIENFNQPFFDKCQYTNIVGAPRMPFISKQYILPKNAEILSIVLSDTSKTVLSGSYLVYPAQTPGILDGRPAPPFVQPDSFYYSSILRYSGNVCEVVTLTNYFGYHMIKLRIYPLQYIAALRQLILFSSITININYQISGTDPLVNRMTSRQLSELEMYLNQTIDNPANIEQCGPICNYIVPPYEGTRPLNLFFLPSASIDNGADNIEYLIITNEELKSSFQILADWKLKKGIPALVVTTDQIEAYYPGFDLSEKIFNYLKDVYNTWGTVYVLLGGDTEIIPDRIATREHDQNSPDVYYYRATDLYYCDVFKPGEPDYNWNHNRNADFWDEDSDLDQFAEHFLGRAPIKNPDEAINFVNRAIQYELSNFSNSYKNVTLIGAHLAWCCDIINNLPGSAEGMKNWMNPVHEGCLSSNILDVRIYDDDVPEWNENYNLNKINVLNAINGDLIQGDQHIIAHIDHSGFSSMGTSQLCQNQRITYYDIDNIPYDPDVIPKIVFSGGCEPNEFNKDCIAEHFINGSDNENNIGMAIGFIGNSGFGYSNSQNQCTTFFQSLYITPVINLGKAFNESRNSIDHEYGYPIKRNLNFLGDPELPVWTHYHGTPLSIQVNPSSLTTGKQDIEVIVSGLAYYNEAYVCLYKTNEIYGVKQTVDHHALFTCVPDTPGPLIIRATAPNYLYGETTINILQLSSSAHLYIQNVTPSSLTLQRGRNLFKIVLKNTGSIEATNISSVLSTESSYASITQNQSSFPNINQNNSLESNYEYEITVSEEAYDLVFIPLRLDISTDQGHFVEEFSLQVKTSQLIYRGNKISKTTNEDIFIDPGETVLFNVELLNNGSSDAQIASTLLECVPPIPNNPYFVSISQSQFYPVIPAQNSAWCTVPFQVVMRSNLPFGITSFPLTLMITTSDGKIYNFNIRINNTYKTQNLAFISDKSSITLSWDHQASDLGYNIYRLDPDSLPPGKSIEDSSFYIRLNYFLNQFSTYADVNLQPTKIYYYKLALYKDGLPQGPYTPAFKAWTTLPSLEPWPLFVPDYGLRSEGSPILYDAIPSRFTNDDNPELEIFLPMDDGASEEASKSAIYGFYSDGEELYNIDNNITTYAGFANFEGNGMKATPIVGEMNNDAEYGEIAVATTYGQGSDIKKTILYSAGDENLPSGFPDIYWNIQLEQAVKNSLVGSTLQDGEGYKIIAAEIWGEQKLDVLNAEDGGHLFGWPVIVGAPVKPELGIPVCADLDGDKNKEIIIGSRGTSGVFAYRYDGTIFYSNPFFLPQPVPPDLIGMDCKPVIAEIDQSPDNPEIILLSAHSNKKAHIFALDNEGNEVNNWEYNRTDHIIDISTYENGNYPALSVADLDYDGIVEIIVADAGKLWVWKSSAELFNKYFPVVVDNLTCQGIAPLVANVDSDPENEIIIASNSNLGKIYAVNLDGTLVPGWPLAAEGLMATPAVGDVDHDGLNEIVAAYGGYVNVWKTTGETGHDQWPLYRQNTFNNAAYEVPSCNYDPNNPWTINPQVDPLLWEDYRILTRDIIIPEDVTLTITGRVAMPDNSRIIVERGGTLKLDGGVITSACNGMWQGIEVWGYRDKSQLDPDFVPGLVEISNGGAIENAKIAIATIKSPDGLNDVNYTGGVVRCDQGKFLNNIYAIRFYYYRNFNPYQPGVELPNISSIKNATFETNGRLPLYNSHPVAFVRMDDVKGVKVSGTYFINSSEDVYGWDARGTGIETHNATFLMDEMCLDYSIPCQHSKRNYFHNLKYGVRAFGQGRENGAIIIMHSDFNLNQNGVFISDMNNAQILFSNFIVPERETSFQQPRYGMYLEYSSGYVIEENTFTGFENGSYDQNLGLYISNSGPEPNEVYKNDFTDLNYGIIAYGQNRNETGEGLCLKCNNFEICMNDIHVIPEKDPDGRWLQGRNQGIATAQGAGGSDTAPAGNTFTDKEELSQTFNYFNHDECNMIDYYHHQSYPPELIIEPDPYSEEMVTLVLALNTNYINEEHACPSNFGGSGTNPNLEKSFVSFENVIVDTYVDSIQLVEDGGNTYALNLDVYTSTPDEAFEVRQELLDESPYLSDTVMKSAIEKENVLPNVMIRDVLVANPQAAKSSEVLGKINERNDPMPEEMMGEILDGRTYKGNLEILEDSLAKHKTLKFISLHKLESYYKNDTLDLQGALDSLINTWTIETDPHILYKLAFMYLYNEDSSNCFSTLNLIPQLTELSTEQVQDYNDYSTLATILWKIMNDSIAIDSNLSLQLYNLSLHSSKPGSLARNILVANRIIEYNEPLYLSSNLKCSIVIPDKPREGNLNNQRLKVFPNPATDYIVLSYDLSGLRGSVQLLVTSTDGKPLLMQELTGIKNQVVLSTKQLSSARYFVQLVDKSSLIESASFIIVR
jgi:hypothetical protein